jgi:hypothetical protein
MMIPVDIDVPAILVDLTANGWSARSIEMVCGFSNGYVAWLTNQVQPRMQYKRAARLYNLWCSEQDATQGAILECARTHVASTS